jgi:hypothetical protein
MNVTLIGSCRLSRIKNNNLNNRITYAHSTKEAIQFIKFLKNEITIPEPYSRICFRTGIVNRIDIEYSREYKELFDQTEVFIIEICSSKKYIHNEFYLHHLSVDERFKYTDYTPKDIRDSFKLEKQSDEEIESDILELKKILIDKKFIIVSHYNSKINGNLIPSRNHLINLLENICKKHKIHFINPTKILAAYGQEEIMGSDFGHYTETGLREIGKYVSDYIKIL